MDYQEIGTLLGTVLATAYGTWKVKMAADIRKYGNGGPERRVNTAHLITELSSRMANIEGMKDEFVEFKADTKADMRRVERKIDRILERGL